MKTLKIIAAALAFIATLLAVGWLDFHIWRLQHPQAPAWTWLFK